MSKSTSIQFSGAFGTIQMDNLSEDLRTIVYAIIETAARTRMTTTNEATTQPQGATRKVTTTPPRQVTMQDDESPIQITSRRRRRVVVQEVHRLHADVLSEAGLVQHDIEVSLNPGDDNRCSASGQVHMDGTTHVFPPCGVITTSHRMAIAPEKRRRSERV